MPGTSYRRHAVHLLLIALLAALIYSNTLAYPFHFDDFPYIVDNPAVRDPGLILRPGEARELLDPVSPELHVTVRSRPLVFLSFALDYALHGLDVRGYHAANMAVHIAASWLLYALVLLTFRTPRLRGSALKDSAGAIAFFSALLFAAHPVQTQAVTYIAQRFASLAALFSLAAMVSYAKFRLSPSRMKSALFYALCLLSVLAAMKSKETAFTLPLAIALYEAMFFYGKGRRLTALAPLFATMLIIPLTLISFDRPLGEAIAGATRTKIEISRGDYLVTQFRVVVTYLRLLLLPVNQTLDYDYPLSSSLFSPGVLMSAFIIASLVEGLLRLKRHREPALRVAAFGGLWFFLALSVESSIIPLADLIFEHRLYLPAAGALAAFVTAAYYLAGRRRAALAPLLCLLVLAFAAAAHARNSVWRDSVTLWEDVVRKAPGNARAHYNLGIKYKELGMLEEAMLQFHVSARLKPDSPNSYNNMGVIYAQQGHFEKAIELYGRALALEPGHAEALNNLGISLAAAGRLKEAEESFRKALGVRPRYAEALNNLGNVFYVRKDYERASRYYRDAIAAKADYAEARSNLVRALVLSGRGGEAREEFRELERLDPEEARALSAMPEAAETLGEGPERLH